MTEKISQLSHWLLTAHDQAKAKVKYDLKYMETRLNKHLDSSGFTASSDALLLCSTLANKYLDYLKLIDENIQVHFPKTCLSTAAPRWSVHFNVILKLKQKLINTTSLEEQKELIIKLASLYHRVKTTADSGVYADISGKAYECFDHLNALFLEHNPHISLVKLVDFYHQYAESSIDLALLFRECSAPQLQVALDFFAQPSLVDLFNAIFFYKLYPEKLFCDQIHPEKLISIRMRLGVLHQFIELIQKKLYRSAQQNRLTPETDYLFHGEELPHGVMIEINEEFIEAIQMAVKRLNVTFTSEEEDQVTLERLYNLRRSYKFWFNPNRLIDAVMVLQQRLLPDTTAKENKLIVLQQEMVNLYHQLSTTECLDLYGYFANNDTRYLLYTLFIIISQKAHLDWLPLLNQDEKKAVVDVFEAVQCVMEALRVELKNRHVATEAYVYDLGKEDIQIGHRNRDAVFRIIAIYGSEKVTISPNVEKLFHFVEGIE